MESSCNIWRGGREGGRERDKKERKETGKGMMLEAGRETSEGGTKMRKRKTTPPPVKFMHLAKE